MATKIKATYTFRTRRGARRFLTVLACVIAILGVLTVPEEAWAQDKAEKLRAVLAPDVAVRIEAIAQRAADQGVPTRPIFDKALEGAAKGVPGARIVPAVEAYAGRLRVAQGIFGPAGPAWVIAGADALGRGVSPEALVRVGSSRAPRGSGGDTRRRAPTSVVVLGDLVEAGVPTDRALEVLEEAVRSGQAEADLVAISRTVHRLIRDGNSPRDAAQRMVRDMKRGVRVRGMNDRPVGRMDVRPGPPVSPGAEPQDRPKRRGGS